MKLLNDVEAFKFFIFIYTVRQEEKEVTCKEKAVI